MPKCIPTAACTKSSLLRECFLIVLHAVFFFGSRVEVVAHKILDQGYVHNLEHNLSVNKFILVLQPTQAIYSAVSSESILRRYPEPFSTWTTVVPLCFPGLPRSWHDRPLGAIPVINFNAMGTILPPLTCFNDHVPLQLCVHAFAL